MKNTLKLCMISLLVLAGIAVLSCTDGEFKGTDGAGNLNIVGIPSKYNGKYCAVETDTQSLTFGTSSRIQIKRGSVRAPLYRAGGEKYESSDNLTVTVNLYDNAADSTPSLANHNLGAVKFYSGSGVVDWKEPPAAP